MKDSSGKQTLGANPENNNVLIESVKLKGKDILDLVVSTTTALTESKLNGIPIVGMAASILDIRDKFQEVRLSRNISAYLKALEIDDQASLKSCIPLVEIDNFSNIAMSILMSAESEQKSEWFGNLHFALSRGMISFDEFKSISLIVSHSSIPCLLSLKEFEKDAWEISEKSAEIATLQTTNNNVIALALSSGLALPSAVGREVTLSLNGLLLVYFGFKYMRPWLHWLGCNPRNLDLIRQGDYKLLPAPKW